MARHPRLDEAVSIFTELGWAGATFADAPTLPLGTEAQQHAALAGLRTGDLDQWWFSDSQRAPVTDVDAQMLGLFAIRVGVDARRAWTVSTRWHRTTVPEAVLAEILAQRDRPFAQGFVDQVCASTDVAASACRQAARLVAQHRLAAPEHRRYLEDGWLPLVAGTGLVDTAGQPEAPAVCDGLLAPDRFAEHLRAAVAVGLEPWISRWDQRVPFSTVVVDGVRHGWVDRDEAVGLVLAALDASGRPGDRKAWLAVWLDGLHATDEEICSRAEVLVPVLAAGDAFTLERLAPVLIAGVGDDLLADVATVALAAPTKKALRTVLEALARRPRPSGEAVEVLGPQVVGLEVGRDRPSARAVQAVVDAWGLTREEAATASTAHVEGLWRPVPPVWTVPRFDHGEETPEALTQAAAELSGRRDSNLVDIAVERFLALANAVARRDPQMARTALAGVRDTWDTGLAPVASWVRGQVEPGLGNRAAVPDDRCEPLRARGFSVFRRLGQVPCLLSEPSTVDLRIAPADVLSRLRAYQDAGASVAEADLFLALTRLDVSEADDSLRAGLEQLPVPVVLWSGQPMTLTAGPAVSQYLADPVVEPAAGEVWRGRASVPASLHGFPARLDHEGDLTDLALFPTWGGAVMDIDDYRFNRDLGLQVRRLALRAAPLPPTVVLGLVSARSDPHPAAAADVALAVTEAWDRGLLRPGPPGARHLDLAAAPRRLAADVRSLGEAAREGLLAVVWQILDDLAGATASGQRLATGAADVVETVATLLPEVVQAVADGAADPAVLDLPGTRAVAARSGTSTAVTTAREIVAGLPAPTTTAVAPTTTGPSFAQIWPDGAGTLPAVVDDAALTATWVDPDLPTKMLRFDLTLPDHPGVRLEVVKGWTYDLEAEGQCRAERCRADAPAQKPRGSGYAQALRDGHEVFVSWDSRVERLTVGEHRDREVLGLPCWFPQIRPRTPLSTSLVAVSVGLVAQDGDFGLTGEHLVTRLVDKGLIGWAGVRTAVVTLLGSPEVSPARLVRVLEKNPTTLPVLWPLLTEPIRVVGLSDGPPPRWLNRVLDVALLYADHLGEAARRGWIPADASRWPGLAEIAARPGKAVALTKARTLLAAVRGDGPRRAGDDGR